ncbi:MAG: sulfotransferase domain-containing protein [Chromatiaceae bacterium]|nr:sulfotransferase domain-containing protein [Chromatiaceae bacterium]
MNRLIWHLRRLVYGEPVIVVSGLPRSGTSMLMQMLAAGGLALLTDARRAADEDNPQGYFELEQVRHLPDGDRRWLRDARGKAVKVVSTLLRELPDRYNYKVILMRRDLGEVLASQARMLARRGQVHDIDQARMRRLFEDDLWRATYLLRHASHFDHLEVDYAQVIEDPQLQAGRIADFVAAGLNVDNMAGAVDSALYRNRCRPG